jgi:hypothetical protein
VNGTLNIILANALFLRSLSQMFSIGTTGFGANKNAERNDTDIP